MILLVAGGRTFGAFLRGAPRFAQEARAAEVRDLRIALDYLHERVETIFALMHGAARGADTVAAEWAQDRAVMELAHPADWDRYGKRAGPIRNAEMLAALLERQGQGVRVMALLTPGGTADMRARLVKARVEVRDLAAVLDERDLMMRRRRA